MLDKLIPILEKVPQLNISKDEPMSRHTTFRIGGPAKLFLEALSVDALTQTLDILHNASISPFILGNGSNLLVSDKGFDGVILKASCKKISVTENRIYAEAGALLSTLSNTALKSSLSGLEFAQGIPGSVGGGLVMNAGAYGGEISDVLIKSTYADGGKTITIKNKEHQFAYRDSVYKQNKDFTILSAEFELTPENPETIEEKMHDLAERRRTKQPLEFPSAGSTFKRPEGHFAAALIDECGLKGFSVGGAQVSEKHAGFIINKSNATADDVLRVIEHVKSTVLKTYGITLECEVCFL
ncbi:MAG: UDP-N-acetylmuramate dehydrogenase [Oscillospiraceae bacterium]|nr:UDP-N-acetylmuramate dehydrogenase [Oscillospiraceae bacterium]